MIKKLKDTSQLEIKMPYFSGLSCNHYKFAGGRFTKPEVKEWMRSLTQELELSPVWSHIAKEKGIKVIISAEFKNKRASCDTHNLEKIVLDAVALGLGINDKAISTETIPPTIKRRDYGIFFGRVNLKCAGELTIKIEELKEFPK